MLFAPSEGGRTVHVFCPQILRNGTPDGPLWLRNVKCRTSVHPRLGVDMFKVQGAPSSRGPTSAPNRAIWSVSSVRLRQRKRTWIWSTPIAP